MGELALPPGAYAAALASLPGAGPAWLARVFLDGGTPRSPEQAWQDVVSGRLPPPGAGAARPPQLPLGLACPGAAGRAVAGSGGAQGGLGTCTPERLWQYCQSRRIRATWIGGPGYPARLAEGPAPPGVLFWVGDIGLLERPCVAVVGTRRCTPDGQQVAYQLGRELSAAGACVVSGLAAGIDGAAHAGALAAACELGPEAGATVGIAASGVDVAYPPRHRLLWEEVTRKGAVISEAPPGRPAQSWRFPSRNRVIAGLARLVVVVESHAKGGSWHTVEAALARGVEVAAVPGSVLSPASVGTNLLIKEGALAVASAQDVLDALGLPARPGPCSPPGPAAEGAAAGSGGGTAWGPVHRSVLGALGRRPRTVDEIVERSGLPLGAVLVALDDLEQRGAALGRAGWWALGTFPGSPVA